MSQGFWVCCPCISSTDNSDTSGNNSNGSSEDTRLFSEDKPLTFPKHSLRWRLKEILQQHCESQQQLRRLLAFVHKILDSYDSSRTPGTGLHNDPDRLWAVLGALPGDPQFRDRCRELLQVLEKSGINMSLLHAASKDTHLLSAIKTGNRAALDALLHTRCDINATDRYSSTCLIYAVKWNDTDTVRTILARFSHSLNLDKADYANYTALAYAASNNALDLCRMLLDAGARPDVNSTSPLFLAVDRGASLELIELLISKGASVNVSSSDGLNAVAAAVRTRRTATVSLLLNSGANEPSAWHKSKAFLIALGMDHLDILQILVRHGMDITCTNPKGSTVAHEACARGSSRFLRHVIDTTDVDLDVRNRQRRSAAHCAADQGYDRCLRALYLAGADCWSLDPQGLSTLQIVLFHNRAHCVSFFLDLPVFPRQALFSTLHVLRNRYDPEALGKKPAVAEFASLLHSKWGECDQVDTLLTTSVIVIRRILGQEPVSKVKMLPLPEKMKMKIVNYL